MASSATVQVARIGVGVLEVEDVHAVLVPMRTRLPFRYGIAELTVAPHVIVEMTVRVDGGRAIGRAADHLPPKWFTKDPDTTFAQDLPGLVAVVQQACAFAEELGSQPDAFAWWDAADLLQTQWADNAGIPRLLAGLGTSLVERAVIDGVCRNVGQPFLQALRGGMLGFTPERIHPDLQDQDWTQLVGAGVRKDVAVRHTVGLSDPLTPAEAVREGIEDGLPVSVEEVVEVYGIDHLKIKLTGDLAVDLERLQQLVRVVGPAINVATVDGNEQFTSADHLTDHWESLRGAHPVRQFMDRTLAVLEQPLHRDVALHTDLSRALSLPPTIIDESDAERGSARTAVEKLGYSGTSFKSCKGVFRGLANAAWLRRRRQHGKPGLMTAEDLSNIGPVALLQDLAGVAAIGVDHVERNGHHYFGRPAAVGPDTDDHLQRHHPDLYGGEGPARILISEGRLSLRSVVDSPYGYAGDLDTSWATPLSIAAALEAIGEGTPDLQGGSAMDEPIR